MPRHHPKPFAPSYSAPLERVAHILEQVEQEGSFFTSGCTDGSILPQLALTNGEEVALPISKVSAALLITHATMAPFGHGEATIIDKNVRNTWQLDPSQFALKSPQWQANVVNVIAHECAIRMGVATPEAIEAKLYKLLVYEEGGKFELHQDSEKQVGMFGTLVILLPSEFTGGELVVYPPGANTETAIPETWKPQANSLHGFEYAAFYGDCTHAVRPVTSGHRICLTYNLIKPSPPPASHAQNDHQDTDDGLNEALKDYFSAAHVVREQPLYSYPRRVQEAETPRVFTYVLDHEYTDAGLQDISRLKNKDYTVAQLLRRACERLTSTTGAPLFELYLCNVTYCLAYDPDYEYEDENDKERTVSLDGGWWPVVGGWMAQSAATLQVDWKSELAPLDWVDTVDEFDDEDTTYTGNEGARQENWYKTAALVMIPIRQAFKRVVASGPAAIASQLRRASHDLPSDAPLRQFAKLAFKNVLDWSTSAIEFSTCVDGAIVLDDVELFAAIVRSARLVEYQPAIAKAVGHFGWSNCVPRVLAAVENRLSDWSMRSRVNLVCSLIGSIESNAAAACEVREPSVAGVVDKILFASVPLPVDTITASPYRADVQLAKQLKIPLVAGSDEVTRLFQAVYHAAPGSIDCLRKCLSMDSVPFIESVVPAVLNLASSIATPPPNGIRSILTDVRDHIAAAVPSLRTWKVEPAISIPREHCPSWRNCEDCSVVESFLSSETESVLRIRAVGKRRDHVAAVVDRCLIDIVTHTTDRQGRPHALVITKRPINSNRLKICQQALAKIDQLLMAGSSTQ